MDHHHEAIALISYGQKIVANTFTPKPNHWVKKHVTPLICYRKVSGRMHSSIISKLKKGKHSSQLFRFFWITTSKSCDKVLFTTSVCPICLRWQVIKNKSLVHATHPKILRCTINRFVKHLFSCLANRYAYTTLPSFCNPKMAR